MFGHCHLQVRSLTVVTSSDTRNIDMVLQLNHSYYLWHWYQCISVSISRYIRVIVVENWLHNYAYCIIMYFQSNVYSRLGSTLYNFTSLFKLFMDLQATFTYLPKVCIKATFLCYIYAFPGLVVHWFFRVELELSH